MRTVSIPLAAVKGPSRELAIALLDGVIESINEHSDVFEYSIDEALLRIHDSIDVVAASLSFSYPDIVALDYMLVFNGTTCDFLPCNEYTQEIADIMMVLLNHP